MEARELVERAVCSDDARSSLIRLTPEGSARARVAREVLGCAISRSMQGALTDEQISQLSTVTEAIAQHLGRRHTTAARSG
jgi:DNA-binding MarR family transcriptional regulator